MSLAIKARLALLIGLAALALGIYFLPQRGRKQAASSRTALRPGEDAATADMIQFLEGRVRRSPDDHVAQNMLAGNYLRRARQTGDQEDVALAFRATRASLQSVPAFRNTGGLTLLAHEEYASHAFADARDHALQLVAFNPDESGPYEILGDALLELGQYAKAAAAYREMREKGSGIEVETRLGRLALLHGGPAEASRRFSAALALTLHLNPPPRETVAWCRWQLGDVAFASGDYATAERQERAALAAFPDYAQAVASLGRVRAARGERAEAIAQYERAVHLLPNPVFIAALGDLYHLSGREQEAEAQYALVTQNGQSGNAGGTLPDRQLALFYADHNLRAQEAYTNAARVYQERADIYGADIVAWTALKAGKTKEAQTAIKAALRLGTQDARFFYHAGLIAQAAGNNGTARQYLRRALALNPQFDPLQAQTAQNALQKIEAAQAPANAPSAAAAGRSGEAHGAERKQGADHGVPSGKTDSAGSRHA